MREQFCCEMEARIMVWRRSRGVDFDRVICHGRLAIPCLCYRRRCREVFDCLRQILLKKVMLAIYMGRHGIFRRNDEHWTLQQQLAGEQTPLR
jgi:hypothetical protein